MSRDHGDGNAEPRARSDEDVERDWRGGVRSAFAELFRRHYPGVVAYATRFTEDRAAAEDVAQQAFLNVLQRRRGSGRFKALIYTVARNLALNERRRRGRRYTPKAALEDAADPPAEQASPLRRLVADEERRAFEAALDRLEPDEREAFVLKETEGLTYGEVGQVLGLHPDAVRRRVAKAFDKLRRLLQTGRKPT